MTETRDFRSVVEAAEQAAAAGDYAAAEELLHAAALLQEASLGPLHPDLANTLNNLGVVCEITEKPADAERYFRRACEIATTVLAPDHPFVATSRKNLEDFCSARGIAVDAPPPPPEVPSERDAPTMGPADLPISPGSYEEPRPAASRGWSRPIAIAALIAGALVVALIATATWRGESGPADAPKEVATTNSEPAGVAPKALETPPPTPASPPIVKPTAVPPAAKSRATTAAPPEPPIVAAAHLCKELSTSGDWQCVPPSPPVGPGLLFFYSRVTSRTDTTVQHRWYRGDRLRQSVELRIRANTSVGYRTYSRQTVDSQGAADWRVELRTRDGVLLHEERFVVR